MAVKIPVVGAFFGTLHTRVADVFTDGRSLHPLQRTGAASHSGFPNVPGGGGVHFQDAPAAGGYHHSLTMPAVIRTGLVNVSHVGARFRL